jgi:hypothetical protein
MASLIKRAFLGKVHTLADKLDRSHGERTEAGFGRAASELELFAKTDPDVDGEDCLKDCEGCTVKLPSKWKIDDDLELYGHIKGWERHLIVATGKADWVSDSLTRPPPEEGEETPGFLRFVHSWTD